MTEHKNMALNFCRKIFRSLRETGTFQKGKEQGKNKVSIKGVTYEGILKVYDEEKFKELLVAGIGRGKAYGMGLLTIVHI